MPKTQSRRARPAVENVWMTRQEAAEYLNVTERWLIRARFEGGGPPSYGFRGTIRYKRHELDEWADEQRKD
jgi:excisionase family DNA binding protein